MSVSALYCGHVQHTRLRPRRHQLRYSLFNLLVDLDELPVLSRRLRLFKFDRAGVMSFHQTDHGDGTAGGLRPWVETHLRSAGLQSGGAIRVLCMPRVFGHCFNPLSVFFCHTPDGGLSAILYQVNNTFGQRHSYLIAVEQSSGVVRQECEKAFYVSPFMDMDLRYEFVVHPPAETTAVTVNVHDAEGLLLAASFAGEREALTDRRLALALLRAPLLGLKVVAGIHWEALKIWRKGLRLRPRPDAPAHAVTIPVARGASA
ncbi:DUF1365 domain-containing protein [Acidisphaera sp. L21]|uniref:DUF1365 domain-containing protein n=1 Tax=Acidisphaera sp. L21 TaxID=1641851 RepID=UPI00131DF6D6|nr:DUF1365 family protein [Acidisphaera sp. L21]